MPLISPTPSMLSSSTLYTEDSVYFSDYAGCFPNTVRFYRGVFDQRWDRVRCTIRINARAPFGAFSLQMLQDGSQSTIQTRTERFYGLEINRRSRITKLRGTHHFWEKCIRKSTEHTWTSTGVTNFARDHGYGCFFVPRYNVKVCYRYLSINVFLKGYFDNLKLWKQCTFRKSIECKCFSVSREKIQLFYLLCIYREFWKLFESWLCVFEIETYIFIYRFSFHG